MPPRPAPRDLRASDSDRERVVAMLAEALADGRLSHEEYSERMPLALAARTLGELAGLTSDLAAPEHQPLQLDGGQQVAALFATTDRRGRWVVPANVTCVAAFGEVVLDFTQAILQDRHVVVTVYALFGKVRLIVPAGVEVVMSGNNILGRQRGGTTRRVPTSSEIPVIEVRGHVAASEVLARTPPRPRRGLFGRRRELSLRPGRKGYHCGLPAFRRNLARLSGASARDCVRRGNYRWLRSTAAWLARLGVPAFVCAGSADPWSNDAVTAEIAACLRHPEVLVIDGAGHLPNLEAEREFNDALRGFLQAHAPG